jgi:hypothetical protein
MNGASKTALSSANFKIRQRSMYEDSSLVLTWIKVCFPGTYRLEAELRAPTSKKKTDNRGWRSGTRFLLRTASSSSRLTFAMKVA